MIGLFLILVSFGIDTTLGFVLPIIGFVLAVFGWVLGRIFKNNGLNLILSIVIAVIAFGLYILSLFRMT